MKKSELILKRRKEALVKLTEVEALLKQIKTAEKELQRLMNSYSDLTEDDFSPVEFDIESIQSDVEDWRESLNSDDG